MAAAIVQQVKILNNLSPVRNKYWFWVHPSWSVISNKYNCLELNSIVRMDL